MLLRSLASIWLLLLLVEDSYGCEVGLKGVGGKAIGLQDVGCKVFGYDGIQAVGLEDNGDEVVDLFSEDGRVCFDYFVKNCLPKQLLAECLGGKSWLFPVQSKITFASLYHVVLASV